MSIATTISTFSGAGKILNGQYATPQESISDMWNNANAVAITMPHTIGVSGPDVILFKSNGSITISFTPDENLDDGQGFYVTENVPMDVVSTSGNVYFLSNKYNVLTNSASDAYASGHKQTVTSGSVVRGGYLLCDKTSSFSVMVSFGAEGGRLLVNNDTYIVVFVMAGELWYYIPPVY